MKRVLIAAALVLAARPSSACDTPVYRYARTNWTADVYRVTLSHAALLSENEERLAARLEAGHRANLRLRIAEDPEANGPRLSVRFPGATDDAPAVWSGPLTERNSAHLLDSPKRREAARHLVAGSTVWFFLASGDATADAKAEALLRAELAKPGEGRPPYAVVRVNRDDAEEAFLVRLLLASEPDLSDLREPMAFPVFGRGRVLYALTGAGIHAGTIAKAVAFLGGACSCTVKKDNPGVDLLLSADWGEVATETPPPPAVLPPEPTYEVTAPRPEGTSSRGPYLAGLGITGVLVVASGVAVWRSAGRRRG